MADEPIDLRLRSNLPVEPPLEIRLNGASILVMKGNLIVGSIAVSGPNLTVETIAPCLIRTDDPMQQVIFDFSAAGWPPPLHVHATEEDAAACEDCPYKARSEA